MQDNENKPNRDEEIRRQYENQQKLFNEQWKKMMPDSDYKMPLYKQFITSFKGSKYYPQFLMQPAGTAPLYFLFMILIVCLFSIFVPVTGSVIGMGGIGHYLEQNVPDFQLKDAVLKSENTMEYESATVKFYLDTDVEKYTKTDIDTESETQILVSRTNVLVYSGGMLRNFTFSQFPTISFNKQDVLRNVPIFYVMLIFYFIFGYIMQAVSALMMMLLLAVIGVVSNNMNQFSLKFSQLFMLAIYAGTIISVLDAINVAVGIVPASVMDMVGMVWTAFVYLGAVTICGALRKGGQFRI